MTPDEEIQHELELACAAMGCSLDEFAEAVAITGLGRRFEAEMADATGTDRPNVPKSSP